MSDPGLFQTPDGSSGGAGLVVEVDVGGTKVAAGLVDPGGTILHQTRVPMVSKDGVESALFAVRESIRRRCRLCTIAAELQRRNPSYRNLRPGPLDPHTVRGVRCADSRRVPLPWMPARCHLRSMLSLTLNPISLNFPLS